MGDQDGGLGAGRWHQMDESFWWAYLLCASVLGKFTHPRPEVLELPEMVGVLDKDFPPVYRKRDK